jgi:hypothetical protein
MERARFSTVLKSVTHFGQLVDRWSRFPEFVAFPWAGSSRLTRLFHRPEFAGYYPVTQDPMEFVNLILLSPRKQSEGLRQLALGLINIDDVISSTPGLHW